MKRINIFWAAALAAAMILGGCGQTQTEEQTPVQETEQAAEPETAQEETGGAAQEEGQKEEQEKKEEQEEQDTAQGTEDVQEETEGAEQMYEDNFAVEEEAVIAFGDKIKEAVAAKDMEALAALTSFPVYVGLPDTDGMVETKEELLELGTEKVLTEEMTASVAEADLSGQKPSMAGFIVAGKSGRPNIIFGVVEGKLAITGMNY